MALNATQRIADRNELARLHRQSQGFFRATLGRVGLGLANTFDRVAELLGDADTAFPDKVARFFGALPNDAEKVALPTGIVPPSSAGLPPAPLVLAGIPHILTMLGLSPDQRQAALDKAKADRIFAGRAAVDFNYTSQDALNEMLSQQSASKVQAAVQDIAVIAERGAQLVPDGLCANWGNNGVNPPDVQSPAIVAAVSAAANAAQNMVMVANTMPVLASALKPSVEAAQNMVTGLLSSAPVVRERAQLQQELIENGLRMIAKECPAALPVNVEDYISARSGEMRMGVNRRLQEQESARSNNGLMR
jgi:hypothetical protein